MNDQYVERVAIKQTESLDIQGSTGIVRIMVKNKDLICFSSNFGQFASIKPATEIQAFLTLMTTECSINTKTIPKKIESFKKAQTPNHCVLSGKITEIIPKSKNLIKEKNMEISDVLYGIVDCGVYIRVDLFPSGNYQVGDNITAEGRLDIRII